MSVRQVGALRMSMSMREVSAVGSLVMRARAMGGFGCGRSEAGGFE